MFSIDMKSHDMLKYVATNRTPAAMSLVMVAFSDRERQFVADALKRVIEASEQVALDEPDGAEKLAVLGVLREKLL